MSHEDFEPLRGLPQALPPGEHILWQGEPSWKALALRAFHVRKVAIYFGILLAWRMATALPAAHSALEFAKAMAPMVLGGAAVIGVLLGSALWTARTCIYTITNRRVALRIGIALSITVNVPFRMIDSAALRLYPDGTGDLPLRLHGSDHIAYVPLWPHVRPWRFAQPDPMLRGVPDAARVARILAAALEAFRAEQSGRVSTAESAVTTAAAPGYSAQSAANDRAERASWPKAVA